MRLFKFNSVVFSHFVLVAQIPVQDLAYSQSEILWKELHVSFLIELQNHNTWCLCSSFRN